MRPPPECGLPLVGIVATISRAAADPCRAQAVTLVEGAAAALAIRRAWSFVEHGVR